MVRIRASRVGLRLALAATLLLGATTPVAASEITAVVVTSSPLAVTVAKPVAFPVTVANTGGNTLNSIVVTGQAAPGFTFLKSTPTSACSQTEPVCTFRQLRSGASTPQITFYYRVPATAAQYPFNVKVSAAEGGKDNSDDTANNTDTFFSNTIVTDVRALDDDFVAGHSLAIGRTFTTGGIDCTGALLPATCNDAAFPLGEGNPHGTAVTMPVDGEVTASDVPPADDCPAEITTCFGHGSQLSVARGDTVPGGIIVTMRWDYTDLPSGLTPNKLDVIHLFDPGTIVDGKTYALITDKCTSPNQTNCFVVEPFKLSDRDIQATFKIPFNGRSKGW
ncbi:MAG TPA: hypothetical protein VFW95_04865 [Candidatus Limnocylindria bacterium]|nr:hypothetical protein [Candidatus Limnocylindria bacterium]